MSTFLVNGALSKNTLPPLDDAALEGTLLRFGAERARALETSVRNEAAENRAANARVNALNEALQALGAAEPDSDTQDTAFRVNLSTQVITTLATIPVNGPTTQSSALRRFVKFDSGTQRVPNNGDFARLREVVRTEVDRASSDSQLNLIRMQGIINRSNQATEFITNIVQRFSGLEDRINPNFRQ